MRDMKPSFFNYKYLFNTKCFVIYFQNVIIKSNNNNKNLNKKW